MTASALLRIMSAGGVELRAAGDRLRFRDARGILTDGLRAALAQHKIELLALLQADENARLLGAELLYLIGERAAIMEFDGGLGRAEARRAAAREVLDTPERLRAYAAAHPAVKFFVERGGEIVNVRFDK